MITTLNVELGLAAGRKYASARAPLLFVRLACCLACASGDGTLVPREPLKRVKGGYFFCCVKGASALSCHVTCPPYAHVSTPLEELGTQDEHVQFPPASAGAT